MNKKVFITISLVLSLFCLVACGKNKVEVKIGNDLNKNYEVIDSDKLDINKSMYYLVKNEKSPQENQSIEIKSVDGGKSIVKSSVKMENRAISFEVPKSSKYEIVVKDNKDKIVFEKQFEVVGDKKPSVSISKLKDDNKQVKEYNSILNKVETAKKSKIKECVEEAKKSVNSMNDSEIKKDFKKQLDDIKPNQKINKTIKGTHKAILGVGIIETQLDFSNDCKAYVDYKEVKVYKTSKNKIRLEGLKNKPVIIVKGKDIYKVVF